MIVVYDYGASILQCHKKKKKIKKINSRNPMASVGFYGGLMGEPAR